MRYAILMLLITLSGCATERPREETEEQSSQPRVYGQLSVSVDRINAE
jgi:hypothetical protein